MIYGYEFTPVYIFLCVLAAYRTAVLFVYDFGPLHIQWHIRQFFANRATRDSFMENYHDVFWSKRVAKYKGKMRQYGTTKEKVWRTLYELFNCPFCFGGWASIMIALFAPRELTIILAIWGGQTLIQTAIATLKSWRK